MCKDWLSALWALFAPGTSKRGHTGQNPQRDHDTLYLRNWIVLIGHNKGLSDSQLRGRGRVGLEWSPLAGQTAPWTGPPSMPSGWAGGPRDGPGDDPDPKRQKLIGIVRNRAMRGSGKVNVCLGFSENCLTGFVKT